jgi:RHS repeat-associated protein
VIQSYTYDIVNRLASAQETTSGKFKWQQSYQYDRWGNRTSLVVTGPDGYLLPTQSTPAVDSSTNRLTGTTYDAAGNTLSLALSVTYDAENRLTLLREPGALRFTYDGDGRRVEKINDDGGPDILVFVYDAAGQMVAEYLSSAGSLPNVKVSYLTADHLSSTRMVTGQSQNVVARHDFLPFGEEIPATVSARSGGLGYGGNDGVRQKFTQKERDTESGLDYFGARYYSSAQGRFTGVDAIMSPSDGKDPQRWNRYSYSGNNPLANVDPDGERWFYTQDDNGGVTAIQWVNPNSDGSYTSPGEGWIEFIPTKDKPFLEVFNGDRSQLYYFGENPDAGPRAGWIYAGGVKDVGPEIVAECLILKGVGKAFSAASGAALNAWRAYRAAQAAELTVQLGSKLDYVLGKATGAAHNVERSTGMLRELEKIGLPDSPATRAILRDNLEKAASQQGIAQANGRILRESLLMGPGGKAVNVQSIWEGSKLITVKIIAPK